MRKVCEKSRNNIFGLPSYNDGSTYQDTFSKQTHHNLRDKATIYVSEKLKLAAKAFSS